MGFVSTKNGMNDEEADYYLESVKLLTLQYGNYNKDGIGIAVGDKVFKSEDSAFVFWYNNRDAIKDMQQVKNAGSIIFHVRTATSGGHGEDAAHPFVSEDGRYILTHNGVLSDYSKYQKELKQRHKFSSDVDSEVILYSFVENGKGFVKAMAEKEISGSMTVIIRDTVENCLYIYTNNRAMYILKDENIIMGMSDNSLVEGLNAIKENTLYKIVNGQIVEEIEVGDLAEKKYTQINSDFYWKQWEKKTYKDNGAGGYIPLQKWADTEKKAVKLEDKMSKSKTHTVFNLTELASFVDWYYIDENIATGYISDLPDTKMNELVDSDKIRIKCICNREINLALLDLYDTVSYGGTCKTCKRTVTLSLDDYAID
jgi:predicted glutamine amidotransferase